MGSSAFNERTDKFLEWFKNIPGATFSDAIQIVDLRDRSAGRGIVAVKDISPETTLFTIPRKAIISAETSQLPKKIPSVFEDVENDDGEGPQFDSWSSLILIMMYEFMEGERSPWKAYFDVLPESFNTPMFWSDEELNELQASATRSKIGKSSAEEMFRTSLIPTIRGNSNIFASSQERSDEELVQLAHRMGSTIMAYAFDLENDDDRDEDESDGWVEDRDGKSLMGMVPMADILNADAEFNTHINHGEDSLTATALRPIKAGEEILNYYGPHPNSELLRRYGYVTAKHSRHDVVEIPWSAVEAAMALELCISQSEMEKVRQELDEDEFEDTFVLERETGEPNSEGSFSGPASFEELPGDLQEQLKAFLKAIKKRHPELVSDKRKRDEIHHTTLAKTLQALEAQYPTTMAQDELLLRKTQLRERQRMAVEVRLGEKRLLREARDFLSGVDTEMTTEEPSGSRKRSKMSG